MKTILLALACLGRLGCASDNLVFEFGFTTRSHNGLDSATGTASYIPPDRGGKNPISK